MITYAAGIEGKASSKANAQPSNFRSNKNSKISGMKIQKKKIWKQKTQYPTWKIKILKITFEEKLEVKILEAKLNT